nr:MAG TPA: hypothetical protein [Caudoviricetes sp.]
MNSITQRLILFSLIRMFLKLIFKKLNTARNMGIPYIAFHISNEILYLWMFFLMKNIMSRG